MKSLKFSTKLALGFGSLVLISAIIGGIGYYATVSMSEAADKIVSNTTKQNLSMEMKQAVGNELSATNTFLLTGNNDAQKEFEEARKAFTENADAIGKMLVTEKGKMAFADIRREEQTFAADCERAFELRRAGKTNDAIKSFINPEVIQNRAQFRTSLDALDALIDQLVKEGIEGHDAAEAHAHTGILIGLIVGFILGVGSAILVARSLNAVIHKMVVAIQHIESNNLAIDDIEVTSEDEIGQACRALNSMKNNLRAIVSSISSTAEQVASASEEISANASQAARSGETQNSQVAQIATAMQEMASTVREVSENSSKAAESARGAAEHARNGGAIVDDTLGLMRSITDSVQETAQKVQELGTRSEQIGKIVGVINDIADQTNLLALNAAIEAARAGDQGRGFAVVADEVRKLAERTSKATKEIAEMIGAVQTETQAAVEKMKSGTAQVAKGLEATGKAGDSLKQIIEAAEGVGGMVTQIATAATEQSAATEQVSSSMNQINGLISESAQGAQQSAQACEQLSSLAMDLQKIVSEFNTGEQKLRVETTRNGDRSRASERTMAAAAGSGGSIRT